MIQSFIFSFLIVVIYCFHLNDISSKKLFKGYLQCSRIPLTNANITIYDEEGFTSVTNITDKNGYFEIHIDKQFNNFLNGYFEFYYNCSKYYKNIYLDVKEGRRKNDSNSHHGEQVYDYGILDPAEVDKIKDTID
uniref:Transthyretin-like family-containing protein n=1 Tax=Strongyloides papillosus TaxID=174720 RepID=A0A0N5C297_STREA